MVNGLRATSTGQSVTRNLGDINVHARTVRNAEGLGDQINAVDKAAHGAQEAGVKGLRPLASKANQLRQGQQAANDALSEDVDSTTMTEHQITSATNKGARRLAGDVKGELVRGKDHLTARFGSGGAADSAAAGETGSSSLMKAPGRSSGSRGGALSARFRNGGAATRGASTPGRSSGRIHSSIGRRAVKGGVTGRTRDRAAAKAATSTGSNAASLVGRTGAQGARQLASSALSSASSAASAMVGRIIAAIGGALGGSTTGIVVGVIAAVMAAIMAVASIFPGMAQQVEDQGSGVPGAMGMVDDYPYKDKGNTGSSPFGYVYGNCTDFVAWRINRDHGVTKEPWKFTHAQLTPNGGNGGEWGNEGNLPGWTVTKTPTPGDVISYKPGAMGADTTYGHVGYIAAVDDAGNVTTENYNGSTGKYYIGKHSHADLMANLDSGAVVIKHDPTSRPPANVPGGGANGDAKAYAKQAVGDDKQFQCLDLLWTAESGWNPAATNASSGAYGIPQALPGDKMASAGSDWKTNPIVQVKWGLTYISNTYGQPCDAWNTWQSRSPHWY